MSKRGNNEGSVYRRKDGRWAAVIDLGWAGGRRRRRAFYGSTRRVVQEQLTAALRARQLGLPTGSRHTTTGAYLVEWLATTKPVLRRRTWERYEQYVRVHALPELDRIPLARLEPRHLQQLYAARTAAGSAPLTVRHLHAVLHRALTQAVRWGLLARNVAELVDPPRAARHEIAALSPEQARALLDAAVGDRLMGLYVLAISTGMRQGELLGLRWGDVDLERGSLHVRSSLEYSGRKFALVEPKTARSRRQITLTQTAVAALRHHRAAQLEERLRLGPAWRDHDLVFTNQMGAAIHASHLLAHSFRPLLKRAGLPRIRFHDLRHSAATLLLGQGVHPKIASEMLGHATIAITLDLYSHVTPTMQREAAATMDALLQPVAVKMAVKLPTPSAN